MPRPKASTNFSGNSSKGAQQPSLEYQILVAQAAEVPKLLLRIAELEKQVRTLTREKASSKVQSSRVEQLETLLSEREAKLTSLQALNDQLAAKVRESSSGGGVKKTSKNSNFPSSLDDPATKAAIRARNKAARSYHVPTGRKPGRPVGSGEGNSLTPVIADSQQVHLPEEKHCSSCGGSLDTAALKESKRIQVWDVPETELSVIDHIIMSAKCDCGKTFRAPGPEGVRNGPVCWGVNVKALAILLAAHHGVPPERVGDILACFGADASTSVIRNWLEREGAQIDENLRSAFTVAALGQPILHVDETAVSIEGESRWVHLITTPAGAQTPVTVYWHGNRSMKTTDSYGILDVYAGHVVSDRYKTYLSKYNARQFTWSPCHAHLERDLTYVMEALKDVKAHRFAKEIAALIKSVRDDVKVRMSKGQSGIPKTVLDRYCGKLRELAREGVALHKDAPTGEEDPRRKAYNLAVFFRDYSEETFTFAKDFNIPFTNNSAERAGKLPKVRLRGKQGWRSDTSTKYRLALASYLATAEAAGNSPLAAIKLMLLGTPLFPGQMAP